MVFDAEPVPNVSLLRALISLLQIERPYVYFDFSAVQFERQKVPPAFLKISFVFEFRQIDKMRYSMQATVVFSRGIDKE